MRIPYYVPLVLSKVAGATKMSGRLRLASATEPDWQEIATTGTKKKLPLLSRFSQQSLYLIYHLCRNYIFFYIIDKFVCQYV